MYSTLRHIKNIHTVFLNNSGQAGRFYFFTLAFYDEVLKQVNNKMSIDMVSAPVGVSIYLSAQRSKAVVEMLLYSAQSYGAKSENKQKN